MIAQPNTFAITGARNITQIRDNALACEFTMSVEDLNSIDALSTIVTNNIDQSDKMWKW